MRDVRFTPGARTAWHTHPRGQTVVSIEPGKEHWHGATPDRFMAHLAMQEADDQGPVVTWLDHETDEDYSPRP